LSPLYTSMLFVPAGDEHKLAKVPELVAPALILDLEDAVAEARKPAARHAVGQVLRDHRTEVPLYVRVNASSPGACMADLREIVVPGLTGIVLPKVAAPRDVESVDWGLTSLEQQAGMPVGGVRIMPTIESVAGVLAAPRIAVAGRRIECLIFGAGDFSLDAGLDWPAPNGVSSLLLQAKQQLVLASRAAGLAPPHDGAYPMFRDLDGLRREAEQARDLGMLGKHAIHPGQVPVIDDVFTPSPEQVAHSRKIVEAFEESERSGVGNVDVGGQFIDYPVAHRARALLSLAERLEAAKRDTEVRHD
jgi:citrate lyase subunit beta / citryl-CoA lyase